MAAPTKTSSSDSFSFVVVLIVTTSLVYFFSKPHVTEKQENIVPTVDEVSSKEKAKYWFYRENSDIELFDTVNVVLESLKLQRIPVNVSEIHYDWDLLWSYEHCIKIPIDWRKVKYHQKVNHLPGSFHLSSKSHLGAFTDSKYVPKAFLTVDDVQKFSKAHPEKRFVVKQKTNRGVILANVTDMNFSNEEAFEGSYAMEFIENPLLFHGHKFDFGVYVVITSVNPLRLYYYNKNLILRFCPKPYDTSDPEDRDRYVVKSSRISGADFPGVKEFIEHGYSYLEAFNAFLRGQKIDEKLVWEKVEDLIRSLVLSKEKLIMEELAKTGASKFSFFEMFRFDMMLDANLNLFLVEVNQSPNVYSRGVHEGNRNVHENMLYNLFNLLGVATSYATKDLKFLSLAHERMVVHENSLKVEPEKCMRWDCMKTCSRECELCSQCQTANQKFDRLQGFLEQMNSGHMKRLVPPKKSFIETANETFWASLQPESLQHTKWFIEMCKKFDQFC